MTEGDWRKWKEATFGSEYMIWHDGLDTRAVTDLRGDARADALVMLRFGVTLGDPHAAEALAAMGDVESIGAMRAELEKAEGAHRVRIARAIHALEPDPKLAAHLVDVLRGPLFWSERIDAAIGLREFSGEEDERALLEAIERDPDYLVRYHACSSLLVRWDVEPGDVSEHAEIFARIVGPKGNAEPGPDDFARFREARALMEGMRVQGERT